MRRCMATWPAASQSQGISKTLVYRLCRYRNSLGRVIPERIITRPPSAELRPDQTDQDSLPPYDILDAILEAYVEADMSPVAIVELGYAPEHVAKVVRLIKINEYSAGRRPWEYELPARLRQGLALSDHIGVGRVEERGRLV